MTAAELVQAEQTAGRAYEQAPKDKTIGLAYANVLRMNGKNTQALAVMQQMESLIRAIATCSQPMQGTGCRRPA